MGWQSNSCSALLRTSGEDSTHGHAAAPASCGISGAAPFYPMGRTVSRSTQSKIAHAHHSNSTSRAVTQHLLARRHSRSGEASRAGRPRPVLGQLGSLRYKEPRLAEPHAAGAGAPGPAPLGAGQEKGRKGQDDPAASILPGQLDTQGSCWAHREARVGCSCACLDPPEPWP